MPNADAAFPLVAIVSANAEWGPVRDLLQAQAVVETPYGECFVHRFGNVPVMFLHGGWGKIAAAASAEYAISRWRPTTLVNLGTCGGFAGRVERGQTLLVTRTIVYDIHEAIGDAADAVAHYATDIDLRWLPVHVRRRFRAATILTGDRDLVADAVGELTRTHDALAADWESGAIAYVAKRRQTRLMILRIVSDLVGAEHGEATGQPELFECRAAESMRSLLDDYALLVPQLIQAAGDAAPTGVR